MPRSLFKLLLTSGLCTERVTRTDSVPPAQTRTKHPQYFTPQNPTFRPFCLDDTQADLGFLQNLSFMKLKAQRSAGNLLTRISEKSAFLHLLTQKMRKGEICLQTLFPTLK